MDKLEENQDNYEGKSVRDLVIELHVDMRNVKKLLEGNGGIGLCEQAQRNKTDIVKMKTYFTILGAILVVGVPILTDFLVHL